MTTIQVFDPALCCSTGVCGVDVDQALVSFSADVEWAKQNGAHLERFNLAQQPQAFAENASAKALLEETGLEGLPLILVNGQQVLAGRYPSRDEMGEWIGVKAESILFTPEVAIGAAIASAAPKACCGPTSKPAESAKSGCC